MLTIKAMVKKDGMRVDRKYNVKLSFTYKRKVKRLSTSLFLSADVISQNILKLRAKLLNLPQNHYFCRNYSNSLGYLTLAHFGQSDDFRREELIRIIEHSVEKLTLAELEALYYDMTTKSYINDN